MQNVLGIKQEYNLITLQYYFSYRINHFCKKNCNVYIIYDLDN